MYFTHSLLPGMLQKHYGRIINVGSVAGEYGLANGVPYSMTKGAISAFTMALAKEVTEQGITVNSIVPGMIRSQKDVDGDCKGQRSTLSTVPARRRSCQLHRFSGKRQRRLYLPDKTIKSTDAEESCRLKSRPLSDFPGSQARVFFQNLSKIRSGAEIQLAADLLHRAVGAYQQLPGFLHQYFLPKLVGGGISGPLKQRVKSGFADAAMPGRLPDSPMGIGTKIPLGLQ